MEDNIPYRLRLAAIRNGLAEKTTKAKEKKPIAKQSEKKKAEVKAIKGQGETPLDMWFEQRREEMTGKCVLCGGTTERYSDNTYRNSIHHIFEKRSEMFPSVSLNEDNWLEVCFWGNSCHTNIHNGTITWELLYDSAEWPMIWNKIQKVYPFIALEERKSIPEFLQKLLQ